MKKVGLLLGFGLMSYQALAGFKQDINGFLSEYIIPLVLVGLLMGTIAGLQRNWETIMHKDTRKEGFINAGWIMGYVVVAVAIIMAVIAYATSSSMNIQIQ